MSLIRTNIEENRFGFLTILVDIDGQKRVLAQCDCGAIKGVNKENVLYGRSKSCGCFRRRSRRKSRDNIEGLRFGLLVVISFLGKTKYAVECDCGGIGSTDRGSLLSGRTKSCGCLNARLSRERNTKHGCATRLKGLTKEYRAWRHAKGRCLTPTDAAYSSYGGRGIKFDERWLDFQNFLDDMGMCPPDKNSIGRIDNDGDYCPDNCQWEDDFEQLNNTRRNHFETYDDRRMTVAQWGRELGVDSGYLYRKLKEGDSFSDIVEDCTYKRGKRK